MTKPIRYSEIFHSIQGEGHYTGVPTAWVRFFLCNLQCNGFGQKDPTNPDSYVLPYKDLDVSTYKTMEELPVFEYGCDSSYSWAAKFKHLAHTGTAEDMAVRIRLSMVHERNPLGLFKHGDQHLCFTGGEPLMKQSQEAIIDIVKVFAVENNLPSSITFETNGTQELTDAFRDFFADLHVARGFAGPELFFSVSPKLYSVSGEKSDKAIKPEVVAKYMTGVSGMSNVTGQLKFVCNGTPESWIELEEVLTLFRKAGIDWPVWIMPVGATRESQETSTVGDIAREAFKRGYRVAARVHTYLWGNQIGT